MRSFDPFANSVFDLFMGSSFAGLFVIPEVLACSFVFAESCFQIDRDREWLSILLICRPAALFFICFYFGFWIHVLHSYL
jgi:hypothetical protein